MTWLRYLRLKNEDTMAKIYRVTLTDDEQQQLLDLTSKGQTKARRLRRAQILLLADQQKTDKQIKDALTVSIATIERTRKRFVLEGFEAALSEKPRRGKDPLLDGKQEAHLVAQACSDAPEGRTSWTMQLLADRLIELDIVETISRETVRRTLKKTRPSLG